MIKLDPEALRAMSLDKLMQLMRSCGISTVGIDTVGQAAHRLIDRAAISPSDK